jgi:DNA polymerase V
MPRIQFAPQAQTQGIDLSQLLMPQPQATHLIRAQGEAMEEAGIFDGDLLVVNRSLKARHHDVVVAAIESEFLIRYLYQRAGRTQLKAANPTYKDIVPQDGQTLEVWGVVTNIIRKLRN